MTRDLVKEEAVARAVRWAECLPADAEKALPGLSTALLHMRDVIEAWREEAADLAKEVEKLEDEVMDLEDEIRTMR